MPDTPHKDRAPPLHRGEVPDERSNLPLLRHLEAIPEQRCQPPPNGPPRHQGARQLCRGHNYGD